MTRRLTAPRVSAAVGLAALLATLAYNAYNIRAQTQQAGRQTTAAQETRITSEVVLLTQLNETFNRFDQQLAETVVDDWFCAPMSEHGKNSLPAHDRAVVFRVLDYYDWLAWLFNQGRIRYAPAKAYWSAKMFQAWQFGDRFFASPVIKDAYPELTRMSAAARIPGRRCH